MGSHLNVTTEEVVHGMRTCLVVYPGDGCIGAEHLRLGCTATETKPKILIITRGREGEGEGWREGGREGGRERGKVRKGGREGG